MPVDQLYTFLPPNHPALSSWNPALFPWQMSKDTWVRMPPVSNTGGKFINTTYGEGVELISFGREAYQKKVVFHPLPEGQQPKSAIIDTLTFTFKASIFQGDVVKLFSNTIAPHLRLVVDYLTEKPGLNNYKRRYSLVYVDHEADNNLGHVCIGGNNDTVMVHITGEGCAYLSRSALSWLASWMEQNEVKITRVDMAHDDIEGNHTIDQVVQWYLDDQFNVGGRSPSCSQAGNWIKPDGSGRTFYVGKRENGKMLRVYEKGKQLGDKDSNWIRFEGELRSKDRVIPYAVLINPGQYLAGMYPCLQWISEIQERVKTTRKIAQISLKTLQKACVLSYGKLIGTMESLGYQAQEIVDMLKREGLPNRLQLPLIPDASAYSYN